MASRPAVAPKISAQFWEGSSRSTKTLTASGKTSSSSPDSTAQQKSSRNSRRWGR